MSKANRSKPAAKKGKRGRCLLRLFMAGNGLNSKTALANLQSICKEYLNGHSTIETIDVVKDFQAAIRDNILVTPALLMVTPRPKVMILGNLSDRPKVLAALRLSGTKS